MIIHTRKRKKKKGRTKEQIGGYGTGAVRIRVLPDGTQIRVKLIPTKKPKTYKEFLKSDVWKKKRKLVLKRDKGKCVHCGKKATQVHHKVYVEWGREKLKTLESVCAKCHQHIHDLES